MSFRKTPWHAYINFGLQKFRVDFDGSKTGVFLPGDIKNLLLMNGFGPTYRFTSRSAAHRALFNAGWRSTSGKRVGQSAFYEV